MRYHIVHIPALAFGTTLLTGILLTNSSVSAETVSRTATVRVADACSLYVDDMTTHTATLMNGIYSGSTSEYANGIGSTTILASCNDSGGFKIYAVGYTDNEYGQTNLTSTTGATIATGTATSGNTSNWAMKLAANTGANLDTITLASGYNAFHSVPNTYAEVASRNSATTTSNGASITTTYATYISLTQPSGAYNGQVKYTLVHPTTEIPLHPETTEAGCIRYYPNGSNVVGTMGCQTVSSSVTSKGLLASNFSRAGYGFAGWSDAYDYEMNPNAHFYGPQESISFTAGQYTGSNPGLSLYAVWIKSQGSLQDASKVAQLCGTGSGSLTQAPTDGTANLSSVSALTDLRDNETYAIAKLADGNCWMIENLRLESNATKGNNQFNPSVTNASLAQGYGTSISYGNFSGLADAESSFPSSNTANSLYSSNGSNNTINIGSDNAAYRIPRYNNLNTQSRAQNNPNSNTFSTSTTAGGMFSYGNYYTRSAAIANTFAYNGANVDDNGNTSETADTSLCPKEWKLPRGGNKLQESTNDIWNLVVNRINSGVKPANYDTATNNIPYYTGSQEVVPIMRKLQKFPNNFLLSGDFRSTGANSRGSMAQYWTSTTRDAQQNYYFDISTSSYYFIYPGTYPISAYTGLSIRCVYFHPLQF